MDCIKLEFEKQTYELTFTRESVKKMEASGFDISALQSKPALTVTALFEGAFMARNRKVTRKEIENIFNHLDDKTELISALCEMYNACLSTLLDSASEDDGKKVTWVRT